MSSKLKLWQVPLLFWEIIYGLTVLLYPALVGLIFRPKGLTYQRNLLYAIARVLGKSRVLISFRKRRTTENTYKYFVRKNGLPEQITTLKDDSYLCWFGSPNADNIIVYFHGGAYVSPAGAGHYIVIQDLVSIAEQRGKSLGVAVLSYGLTPEHRYPTQMKQAIESLRYLIEQQHVPTSKIIVAGDSAGGNMAVAMISHLLHPHKDIKPLSLPTDSPTLNAVLLVSPALSHECNTSSWRSNANKDIMTPYVFHKSLRAFVDEQDRDQYNDPLRTNPEWWSTIPAKHIKILYGSYELFGDDCRQFGEKLQIHNPQTETVEVPEEIHCQSMIDAMLDGHVGPSANLLRTWVMDAIA